MHIIPPAQLWLADHTIIEQEVITYLQQQFCSSSGCTSCPTCIAIAQKQFHAMLWLQPEGNYTKEDLEPLFDWLSFMLDEQQHYFIILMHADRLSDSCANALLKSLEEPPQGYHFILCAEHKDALLPTIVSRCVIQQSNRHAIDAPSTFLNYFCKSPDYLGLHSYLETNKIAEYQSMIFLEKLLHYYVNLYNKAVIGDKKSMMLYRNIITLLQKQQEKAPMPGSSKIFWKNIFLQIQRIRGIYEK